MGDVADMMLDGTLCEGCGVYLEGEAPGYPRYCKSCRKERNKDRVVQPTVSKKVPCPVCGKGCKGEQGIRDHMDIVHPNERST